MSSCSEPAIFDNTNWVESEANDAKDRVATWEDRELPEQVTAYEAGSVWERR